MYSNTDDREATRRPWLHTQEIPSDMGVLFWLTMIAKQYR